MRRLIARLVACALICSALAGCATQPVDPGSPVPPASQPIVALLAAIGLGIGIAAFTHRSHGPAVAAAPATSTAPAFVLPLSPAGIDVAVDQSLSGMVGVLQNSGSRFEEVTTSSRSALGYNLPGGYTATAVTIDGLGSDWFVDAAGKVDKCAAPTSGGPATCTPVLSLSDGITGAGGRSIAADQFFVFIARDNGSGQVSWTAFSLDGTTTNAGSYSYAGQGLEPVDAVSSTTFGTSSSTFTLFHKDGVSYSVAVPASASKAPYVLSPQPNLSPGNLSASLDGSGDQLFFGLIGAPNAVYQIAEYIGTNSIGAVAGSIHATINVAVNGQINPGAGAFVPPLRSIHADPSLNTFALDSNGALIGFGPP